MSKKTTVKVFGNKKRKSKRGNGSLHKIPFLFPLRKQIHKETKQSIYEKWMFRASLYFKDMVQFNITECSDYMVNIYTNYITEQDALQPELNLLKDINHHFYKSRVVYHSYKTDIIIIKTPISEEKYKNLSFIFLKHIESILDTNPENEFSKICKEPTSECSVNEKRISQHDYADPPEAELKYSEFKETDTKFLPFLRERYNIPSDKPERCKTCFKFMPAVNGFQLTDGFLQHKLNQISPDGSLSMENLHKLQKTSPSEINRLYRELIDFSRYTLFNMYVTLPSGKKIQSLSLYNETIYEDHPHIIRFYGFYFFSRLTITHTTYGLVEYLQEIEDAWNKCKDERGCYYLHWLISAATPFCRGSAGFAKVILNAALLRCGLLPVKETAAYFTKSDWVAMLTPTFDDYYNYIKPNNKMFYNFT